MVRPGWMTLLLLAVASLAGCGGPAAPTAPTQPPEVQVSEPVPDSLTEYGVFTGRTQALNSVDIRSRVTGYLDQAPFNQGDDVKKDAKLFIIQQQPFLDALNQARANLEQQKAQLTYNETVYQRNLTLRTTDAVNQQELEQTRSARDVSKANVAASAAALAIAQQNYDWSVIRAPFDGRISRRLVDPGNDVMADNTILASLVELDKLYAYFDVDERTLLRIAGLLPQGKLPPNAAQKFPVTLGLANEKPEAFSHQGKLLFTDNRVDPNSGTLRMWGTFDNPRLDLKPGLFIRVRMATGEPRQAWFVSEAALGADQGRQFLYVVNDANKVVYQAVEVGQRKNGLIAILSGLSGGERVIVDGLQRVHPEVEVQPKSVPMPKATAGDDQVTR